MVLNTHQPVLSSRVQPRPFLLGLFWEGWGEGQAHCSPACFSFVLAKQNETNKNPKNITHLLQGGQKSKNTTIKVDRPSSLGGNVVRGRGHTSWLPEQPSQGRAVVMTWDPASIWFSIWKLPRLAPSSFLFLIPSVDSDPFSFIT